MSVPSCMSFQGWFDYINVICHAYMTHFGDISNYYGQKLQVCPFNSLSVMLSMLLYLLHQMFISCFISVVLCVLHYKTKNTIQIMP